MVCHIVGSAHPGANAEAVTGTLDPSLVSVLPMGYGAENKADRPSVCLGQQTDPTVDLEAIWLERYRRKDAAVTRWRSDIMVEADGDKGIPLRSCSSSTYGTCFGI